MKIIVDRIPESGQRIYSQEPVAQYDIAYLDIVFKDPIDIDVGAQVISGILVVSGKIWTKVQLTCSRCLSTFSREWIDASYHFDCAIRGPNEIIDLTDHIREDIILGLPVKPLCREDCKGLCIICGADRNKTACECPKAKTDIRWSDLNRLKLE